MDQEIAQAVADLVSKYGYPIVAVCGIAYIILFIWRWVVNEIDPLINEADDALIALIDRIRMLDHDLIRLNEKVRVVLHLRSKVIDHERRKSDIKINNEIKDIK